VDPSDGTVGASLETNNWYNARGDSIKTRSPSGLFTKSFYDGAGRVMKTFVSYDTDESTYPEADDVDGDTVISQTEYTRDPLGNVILETRWERKAGSTATGPFTSTSDAERYYVASWYDILGRLVARADYGTNGGSALTRDETPPEESSPTVLLSASMFDEAGFLFESTDPEGHVTRREYDNLGRLVRTVENYDDGTPGPGDLDRVRETDYNSMSQVTRRRTWMTDADDIQETEWVYGVVKGSRPNSEIASNNLVKTILHPDPVDGTPSESAADQETRAYNAQGEVVYYVDRNGTVHEYDFDALGRRTADRVIDFGEGLDQSADRIVEIQSDYDALGRMTSIRSYKEVDQALEVANEVQLDYNGFGQMTRSWQEHTGAVSGSSLFVDYTFSKATGGDPISRLSEINPDYSSLESGLAGIPSRRK
jgi:YD repeat-containing protein